jgi:flavin-dependent dehydrogenase
MLAIEKYDCAIIGGGVAGLSAAILLAKQNRKVILFEKEAYPFNKVCGEYISNESLNFINELGVEIKQQDLPQITTLLLSSPLGVAIKRPLSIGGIGISRYSFDYQLYQQALKHGVEIKTSTKVQQIDFDELANHFTIDFDTQSIEAKIVCGAYGKNSNIDVKMNRKIRVHNKNENFIGVKYHVKVNFNTQHVELHNFAGGYCGMSAIEDDRVNLSYIIKAKQLEKCNNNLRQMEEQILCKNPFLKTYFSNAEFLFDKPLVISHLHFGIKNCVDEHLLMLGDAAGNIAPLSGNGMSIAFLSSKMATKIIDLFFENKINRQQMEQLYASEYQKIFNQRMLLAKLIHKSFGLPYLTDISFIGMKALPIIVDWIGNKIHGDEF